MDAAGVELFKKQVGCLNFPETFHSYDGKTGQWVFWLDDPRYITQASTGGSCCTVNRTLSWSATMLVQLHPVAFLVPLSQFCLSPLFLFQSCVPRASRAAADKRLDQVSFSSITRWFLVTDSIWKPHCCCAREKYDMISYEWLMSRKEIFVT